MGNILLRYSLCVCLSNPTSPNVIVMYLSILEAQYIAQEKNCNYINKFEKKSYAGELYSRIMVDVGVEKRRKKKQKI